MHEQQPLLHNMSAPPRSNVQVAGYRKPRLAVSIHLNVPEDAEIFAMDMLGLEAIEAFDSAAQEREAQQLKASLDALLEDLPILPIEPLLDKWSGPTVSVRPIYALALLSRSTRLFFQHRRAPELTPYRLNRKVYLHSNRLMTALMLNTALRKKVLPETSQNVIDTFMKEHLQ